MNTLVSASIALICLSLPYSALAEVKKQEAEAVKYSGDLIIIGDDEYVGLNSDSITGDYISFTPRIWEHTVGETYRLYFKANSLRDGEDVGQSIGLDIVTGDRDDELFTLSCPLEPNNIESSLCYVDITWKEKFDTAKFDIKRQRLASGEYPIFAIDYMSDSLPESKFIFTYNQDYKFQALPSEAVIGEIGSIVLNETIAIVCEANGLIYPEFTDSSPSEVNAPLAEAIRYFTSTIANEMKIPAEESGAYGNSNNSFNEHYYSVGFIDQAGVAIFNESGEFSGSFVSDTLPNGFASRDMLIPICQIRQK